MTIYKNDEQGTEEWFQSRCGVITASNFSLIENRLKTGKNKGDFSQAAKDYAFKIAVEKATGNVYDYDDFNPWQAKRGSELEPEARLAYEEKIEVMVIETGLALTDDYRFGGSVDGIAGNGIIEIKCFLSPSKIERILFNNDLSEEMAQIQGNLFVTNKEYCDFILYLPQLKNINKQLYIQRIERDEERIKTLEQNLNEFYDFMMNKFNRLIGNE